MIAAKKVTTKSAAARIGSTVSTLTKLRLTADGPPFYKIGRKVVYDIDELDEWMSF